TMLLVKLILIAFSNSTNSESFCCTLQRSRLIKWTTISGARQATYSFLSAAVILFFQMGPIRSRTRPGSYQCPHCQQRPYQQRGRLDHHINTKHSAEFEAAMQGLKDPEARFTPPPAPVGTLPGGFDRIIALVRPLTSLETRLKTTNKVDANRSEEHTSELQSRENLVCRLLLEKKKRKKKNCTIA